MRIVRDEAQIPEALAAERRLLKVASATAPCPGALSARPEDVEVQIFADSQGNYVHRETATARFNAGIRS